MLSLGAKWWVHGTHIVQALRNLVKDHLMQGGEMYMYRGNKLSPAFICDAFFSFILSLSTKLMPEDMIGGALQRWSNF